ncbi:MAG: RNA polymerase sigma factor [Anaerolineae bacterium]|nr:RNA polymerase sigma factor [Anaerolineae bacterium]
MDDIQAINHLKRGDINGLSILVERYQVRALRTAYLITQDVKSAEDVVQDAFLSIYRGIQHFDVRRPFAPWFMRTVVNGALKIAQRHQRLEPLADEDAGADEPTAFLVSDELPEAIVEAAAQEDEVWDALSLLSPERRAVIVLRFYLDRSEIEIADALDIPVGTVKSRLHAAKRQLRNLLHNYEKEG